MSKRIFYTGDVSIEYGGTYYSIDTLEWGYVGAIRITPCSDAGGPDNVFWVERLTVNMRGGDALANIRATCGVPHNLKGATSKHADIEAHIYYGAYDYENLATLQIGPDDEFYNGREELRVTHKARANRSLRKLARELALGRDPLQGLAV